MSAPVFEAGGVRLFHGDCIEVMRELPDESVHAVVTDPPYGIAFMGKAWDQPGEFGSQRKNGQPAVHMREAGRARAQIGGTGAMDAGRYDLSPSAMLNFQRWCEAWARECYRLLKPGGHLLSFGGSRTWHRLASGIEDAGFEVRDSIAWLYGSGFPKSLDVAKAIASKSGRPEDIRRLQMGADYVPSGRGRANYDHGSGSAMNGADVDVELPDEAKAWDGWGTALKPSFEPIVVARKPLAGTVAANVLAHGTGALNVNATRIPASDPVRGSGKPVFSASRGEASEAVSGGISGHDLGRWPSNVVLDESQASELDRQSGTVTSGVLAAHHARAPKEAGILGAYGSAEGERGYGDTGGASRFFPTFRYEAKAPTSERPREGEVLHPTVKPLDLMRWLVRLVTPAGGVVLEPFAGSGTTLEACVREGFEAIGIEREAEYLPLVRKRLEKDHQQALFGDWDGAA